MLARIDRAFERERAFTSDASHELRTPLSILKAEVDLALEGDRSPQELEAALRSVSEETDRLTRLAEDLLVLARADEGRLPLSVEPRRARRARAARGRALRRPRGAGGARAAHRRRGGAPERGPAAPRPGAHEHDRQRAALRRGRRRGAHVAPRRARRAARDRRRRRLPAGARRSGRSTASRARTAAAPARAPGSASRSSPRSPARTAAASTPRTARRAAPTCGSRCPPATNCPLIAPREAALQMVNHHHGGAS